MGVRRQRWATWALALAVSVGSGNGLGCRTTSFACTDDAQCVDGSASGICQPTGWCSFEDDDCASMQRYAEHSASELAGTCVPLDAAEGTTGAISTSEATSATTDAGATTSEPGDAPPLDESTAAAGTSLPPPETGSDGDAEGSTTGEPTPTCEVVLFDDFDDGRVGAQWDPWADGGTSLQEVDSTLRFSIVGEVLAGDDAGVLSVDRYDLTEGHLRIEIAEPPTPDTGMEFYWQLVNEACTLTGLVHGGMVHAFDGAGEYGDDTHWLQVRFSGGLGHLERSADGVAWEPVLGPTPVDCAPEQARVYVFGGAGASTMAPASAAIGTVEACGALAP